CHDSHGISSTQGTPLNNSALINFDTTVVTPDPVTGKLEYDRLGPRAGQCFLSCHGVAHSPLSYPSTGIQPPVAPQFRRSIVTPRSGPVRSKPAAPAHPRGSVR